MVTKSQGLGVVQEEMAGRVGGSYVISLKTPKKDWQPETIQVHGKVEPYISSSADGFESATLTKVE